MFYLNSTLNFGIPPVLVFQLEVYYKLDRLLTGLIAQPKGTTARWYSNKTSLGIYELTLCIKSSEFEVSHLSNRGRLGQLGQLCRLGQLGHIRGTGQFRHR